MVAAGAGVSACCLTLLGTNLASLQPSGYYQQIPTLALGNGALAVPALLEKAQLPSLACPRVFSPPAGHNLRAGLHMGFQGRVDKAKLPVGSGISGLCGYSVGSSGMTVSWSCRTD